METQNAAQVLQNYIWKHKNFFPIDKIRLVKGKIEIPQDVQLEYLMRFQSWLESQQGEEIPEVTEGCKHSHHHVENTSVVVCTDCDEIIGRQSDV